MTTTVDTKKRIVLKPAKPGERFDVQQTADGAYVLRRLEPVNPSVKTVKMIKRKDGSYKWPVKISREEIVAAIRADRESR